VRQLPSYPSYNLGSLFGIHIASVLSHIIRGDIAELYRLYRIKLAHLLTHRRVGYLKDALCDFSICCNLLYLLDSDVAHVVAILNKMIKYFNEMGEASKYKVVRDQFGELGEMPAEPLPYSHRESIHIFIEQL
jgi:hypothetical protein